MKNSEYIFLLEKELKRYLPTKEKEAKQVVDAMEYSLLAPGKRVRPILTLEFCRICGGDIDKALPFACAVEMVHTYSLIHDDLPCMDNDDYRRGRPSNHIKNGEAMALLAGDALLTLAFQIMLSPETSKKVGYEKAVKSAGILAKYIGTQGMIGGQVMDVANETNLTLDAINSMHSKKTGALILAACKIGCVIAGADEGMVKSAEKYANNIGLAFQIVDDILDETATIDEIGKKPGSDKECGKTTYVSLKGIEKSKKDALNLIENAKLALQGFEGNTKFLTSLAEYICSRMC